MAPFLSEREPLKGGKKVFSLTFTATRAGTDL